MPAHSALLGTAGSSAARDRAIERFLFQAFPCLLSVGLLEPEYDLHRQIEAFEQIRATHSNAGLIMIGSGSLEMELRSRIAASPHAASILLTGDVPRPQTLAAIANASLLWRTTLYDGDAVSVREALHFGTPVLASDNGMRPQGIRLIPVADTGALVAATRESVAAPRPAPQPQQGLANLHSVVDLYEELI
jgi:glycosyltransferase involved in cell wall biosynthesis